MCESLFGQEDLSILVLSSLVAQSWGGMLRGVVQPEKVETGSLNQTRQWIHTLPDTEVRSFGSGPPWLLHASEYYRVSLAHKYEVKKNPGA